MWRGVGEGRDVRLGLRVGVPVANPLTTVAYGVHVAVGGEVVRVGTGVQVGDGDHVDVDGGRTGVGGDTTPPTDVAVGGYVVGDGRTGIGVASSVVVADSDGVGLGVNAAKATGIRSATSA